MPMVKWLKIKQKFNYKFYHKDSEKGNNCIKKNARKIFILFSFLIVLGYMFFLHCYWLKKNNFWINYILLFPCEPLNTVECDCLSRLKPKREHEWSGQSFYKRSAITFTQQTRCDISLSFIQTIFVSFMISVGPGGGYIPEMIC